MGLAGTGPTALRAAALREPGPTRKKRNIDIGGALHRPFSIACVTFSCALSLSSSHPAGQLSARPGTFEGLLKEMSSGAADPCTATGRDDSDLENELFTEANRTIVRALNETSRRGAADGTDNPGARLREAVAGLERLGAAFNATWPEEKRFHASVVELAPAFLVGMTYRNRATFSFLAVPQRGDDNKPTTLWQSAYVPDDGRFEPVAGYETVDLFALERGPSKRARFLVKAGGAGCGSGMGVVYLVYEWNPKDKGSLSELIKVEGAASEEEPIEKRGPREDLSTFFPPIGALKTTGSLITLPYCWFSAIDTWDNASLCAVDSYDISRDRPRFTGTVANRPDLLPVAKAIAHAQARDYPAVLAYCASAGVARRIVTDVPPFVSAIEGLAVTRTAPLKERVEIGDLDQVLRFDVERRGQRWVVTAFQVR